MTAADRLAAIRVDLSEHHPYRPVFQEGDICPACSGFGSVGVVPWPCGPVRMADALDAVLALCADARGSLGLPPIDCSNACGDGPCDCSGITRTVAWTLDPAKVRAAITDALGEDA